MPISRQEYEVLYTLPFMIRTRVPLSKWRIMLYISNLCCCRVIGCINKRDLVRDAGTGGGGGAGGAAAPVAGPFTRRGKGGKGAL